MAKRLTQLDRIRNKIIKALEWEYRAASEICGLANSLSTDFDYYVSTVDEMNRIYHILNYARHG